VNIDFEKKPKSLHRDHRKKGVWRLFQGLSAPPNTDPGKSKWEFNAKAFLSEQIPQAPPYTVPPTEWLFSHSGSQGQPWWHSEATAAMVDQVQVELTMWQTLVSSMEHWIFRCTES
jgi:hypothetical protein